MKILTVSLLKRKVAPDMNAARPRMIYELSKRLVEKGHKVSLLGTGDSQIRGVDIIPVISHSIVEMPVSENPFYAHAAYLVSLAKKLEEIAGNFDVVHNHTYPEFINLLVADKFKTPMITTVHAQATKELDQALSLFPNSKLVSISKAHKSLFKKAKIWKVIYNGIDTSLFAYRKKKQDYMLWLGRLSRAKDKKGNFLDPKGIRHAIKLARTTGKKLLLSGNVEDIEFYKEDVEPYLSENIKWVGEVKKELPLSKKQVVELMQNAKVFLMTINWNEPFGLVMVEAMSCGTPVIGFDRGSVAEIVKDGKTGFVVKTSKESEGLKKALFKINQIKPEECRKHVGENFSIEKMVEAYEKAYQKAIRNAKR